MRGAQDASAGVFVSCLQIEAARGAGRLPTEALCFLSGLVTRAAMNGLSTDADRARHSPQAGLIFSRCPAIRDSADRTIGSVFESGIGTKIISL